MPARQRVPVRPLAQEVLQLTDGQVHVPFVDIVTPKLFPLPLGLATMTYWLGQVAETFQVE